MSQSLNPPRAVPPGQCERGGARGRAQKAFQGRVVAQAVRTHHVPGHHKEQRIAQRLHWSHRLGAIFNFRHGASVASTPKVDEEVPAPATPSAPSSSSSQFLDNIIEQAEQAKRVQEPEGQAEEPGDDRSSSSSSEGEDDYSELDDRIGFIGAGQMGEALIRGFINTGVSRPDKICASVRSSKRRQMMGEIGIQAYQDALDGGAAQVAKNSDIIFLAVKPVYLDGVMEALRPHVTPDHLIISIVAGVKIGVLESNLPEESRVIRVMPNTPCLIGQCASAYVTGNLASEEDSMKTFSLMSAVGMTTSVEERMMDAITGLSGSGPAYVFLIIEAMADGAVAAGLPRDKALALAAQTVIGASRMVLEASGDGTVTHPALLKDKVASPAGTTIAGLLEMESSGVRGAMMRAVKASARRSEELG